MLKARIVDYEIQKKKKKWKRKNKMKGRYEKEKSWWEAKGENSNLKLLKLKIINKSFILTAIVQKNWKYRMPIQWLNVWGIFYFVAIIYVSLYAVS